MIPSAMKQTSIKPNPKPFNPNPFPSSLQAVAEHYIMNHAEDPLYLPVMTYHLLQARVSLAELPS